LLGTYAYVLAYSIGVQIVIDVARVWAFFSNSRETLVNRCIAGSTDQEVKTLCDNEFDVGKWTLLVSLVVGLTIQFCEFCFSPSSVKMSAVDVEFI
jgi:hypothetical protein